MRAIDVEPRLRLLGGVGELTRAGHGSRPKEKIMTAPATEAEELRAERDALAAQLDKRGRRRTLRGWFRRTLAAVLVMLFALLLPFATVLTWTHRTVFNAERYVATVAPLGSDPAVTDALAKQLTEQIYAALNAEPAIAAALPPRAAFLAGPISGQVKTFLGEALDRAVSSPQFAELWTEANRFAQAQVVAVLKDNSTTITTQGDNVVLNLVPLLNKALQDIQPQVSAIVGKNITLPTISGNELPAVACEKVSTALGRPLPATCGQIPLFPASKLDAVQASVTRFDRVTGLSLALLPVLLVGAIVVSPRRRRTLLQLTVGSALTVVATRRLLFYLEDQLTSAAKPENQAAAHAIVTQLLDRLVLITVWLLIGALALAFVTLLTGPYPWARGLRHGVRVAVVWVGTVTMQAGRAVSGAAGDDGTRRWVAQHRALLQAAGALVAGVLLLVLSLSPLLLLLLLVLLGTYQLAVVRIASASVEASGSDSDAVASPAPQQRGPASIDLTRSDDEKTTTP
jgi:hypothetical protein